MWQHQRGTDLQVHMQEVIRRRSKLIETLNFSPAFNATVAFKWKPAKNFTRVKFSFNSAIFDYGIATVK